MIIFPPILTLPPSKRLSWKNTYFPGDLINITRLMEAKRKEFLKSPLTAVPFLTLLLPALCLHTIAEPPQWGWGKGQEVQGIFKLVLTILLLPHALPLCLHPSVVFFSLLLKLPSSQGCSLCVSASACPDKAPWVVRRKTSTEALSLASSSPLLEGNVTGSLI